MCGICFCAPQAGFLWSFSEKNAVFPLAPPGNPGWDISVAEF